VQTYTEAAALARVELEAQATNHQGSAVPIYANIGSSTEGRAAKAYGADGVGLYRSELVFLGRTEPPSLQEQVFEYSRLLARFAGRRVIVRLLDLDNDKPLPFLKPAEDGRYTGRGLSTLLLNREVLVTQLEALKRAHDYYPEAELWVMAPMVTAVEQAVEYASLARATGLKMVGAMIEVPEVTQPSVLEEILDIVDFISIGTNDLTRYTLGLNRELGMRITDAKDPRVLNQVRAVIEAAADRGISVGVCGEAAADPELARVFIDWGVSSLSASPALIPALRQGLDKA
jgi:phosphotransferase system enzyme I (PtsI)